MINARVDGYGHTKDFNTPFCKTLSVMAAVHSSREECTEHSRSEARHGCFSASDAWSRASDEKRSMRSKVRLVFTEKTTVLAKVARAYLVEQITDLATICNSPW